MRWFLLLFVGASSALYADTTGIAFASSTCTLGTETQTGPSCGIPVPIVGSNVAVQADASASAGAYPWTIAVEAGGPTGIPYTWTAQANASDTGSFYTPGPARLGLIQFDIFFGETSDDFGFGAGFSDGTHNYSFAPTGIGSLPPTDCGFGHCEFIGALPFELGAHNPAFQVSLSAFAERSNSCGGNCPEGSASLTFSLLETNGTTPVPFSSTSYVATPEPSSLWLLSLGFIGTVARRFNKGNCAVTSYQIGRQPAPEISVI